MTDGNVSAELSLGSGGDAYAVSTEQKGLSKRVARNTKAAARSPKFHFIL
jgi:hypothetical protein